MVALRYRNQTRQSLMVDNWQPAVIALLSKYGLTDNVEVELRFVGRTAMRRLNAAYRHKDRATDVLSFPIWPDLAAIKSQPGPRSLGTIVICLPIAQYQAKQTGLTLIQEIVLLIEHSLLHLLGYHHAGD